jgi:sugar phosphate permease
MDTVFLSVYSLGLFVSGSMGDHYSPKLLLILSYIGVSIVIALISIFSLSGWSNPITYCILFGLNGFMQSFGWPSCCAIFANWFGKRGRGALIGLWASSTNFGNIIGALLTSFFTSTLVLNWQTSYLLIGLLCFVNAIIMIFSLIVHPEEKGIIIEEIDEKLSETERLLG